MQFLNNKKGYESIWVIVIPILMILTILIVLLSIRNNNLQANLDNNNLDNYLNNNNNNFDPENEQGVFLIEYPKTLFKPIDDLISPHIINKYFNSINNDYFPFIINTEMYFLKKEHDFKDSIILNATLAPINNELNEEILNELIKVLTIEYEVVNFANFKDYICKRLFYSDDYTQLYSSNFKYNFGYINFKIKDNTQNISNYIYDPNKDKIGFLNNQLYNYNYDLFDNKHILTKNIAFLNNDELIRYEYPIIIKEDIMDFYKILINNKIFANKIVLGANTLYNNLKDEYELNPEKFDEFIFKFLDYYETIEVEFSVDAFHDPSIQSSSYEYVKFNIINYSDINNIIYSRYYLDEIFDKIELEDDLFIKSGLKNINHNIENYILGIIPICNETLHTKCQIYQNNGDELEIKIRDINGDLMQIENLYYNIFNNQKFEMIKIINQLSD